MTDNEKKLEEFKKTLAGKTEQELLDLEQKIIKDSDESVTNVNYDLEKKGYEEVCRIIRELLEKKSVTWQYTLGLVTMYEFWDEKRFPKTVSYPMLDGTLRTLGELQFTGYEEWKKVLIINKYFESLREQYVETTNGILYAAAEHNAVLDELKKFDPNIVDVKVGEQVAAQDATNK